MNIYPAIDIKGGKCVRLIQGNENLATTYGNDPADMAKRWIDQGATYLHVVDLDGAFLGEGKNLKAVEAIVHAAGKIPVQLGGGIRSLEAAELRFEIGVSRVIIGTAAITDPEIAKKVTARFGDKIIAGIDIKEGKVAVKGWTEISDQSPLELALRLKSYGVTTCVFTDIARDGMLGGVNALATAELSRQSDLFVIASGGVSSLEDVRTLAKMGVHGAIIGKALYDGALDLKTVLEVANEY